MPYSTTGLPVIPYTLTSEFDGIKYEVHPLTNTCQVITEDGTMLCDVLTALATKKELESEIAKLNPDCPWFKLKGTLKNLPDLSAIDQLYSKTTPLSGEVWLVEASSIGAEHKIYDMYVYSESILSWVYLGSTEKKDPVASNEVLQLFPTKLGKPGQYLIVNPTGTGLTWGYGGVDPTNPQTLNQHNLDPEAHAAIRAAIDLKADQLLVFNDVLKPSDWVWDGEHPFFTYFYTSDKLPVGSYMEMTAIINTPEDQQTIAEAGIVPSFRIGNGELGAYGVLQSIRVPAKPIEVTVKIYKKIQVPTKTE